MMSKRRTPEKWTESLISLNNYEKLYMTHSRVIGTFLLHPKIQFIKKTL